MASIFTKIINGEIPSYKVYEDEYVYAFLDIRPIQLGHTLIVPKHEVDQMLDCPEPYYSKVFEAAYKVGKAIHQASGCVRVGSMVQGWEVPHFHYHLVPMFDAGDLSFSRAKERTKEEMESMHKKILENLANA